MRKLSSEVEQLMWTVAEERDPRAIDSFGERFPDLRSELLKRMRMLDAIREAKGPSGGSIPGFKLKSIRAAPLSAGRWALAGAGLAAMAAASYFLTASLVKGGQPAQAKAPYVASSSPFDRSSLPSDPGPEPSLDDKPASVPQPAEPIPASLHPIAFHLERTSLQTVLQAVTQEGNMKLELAPDTPNPEIDADYDQATPIEILKDLGSRYGFTAFDEGDSNVLVIPAVDRNTGMGGYVSQPSDLNDIRG